MATLLANRIGDRISVTTDYVQLGKYVNYSVPVFSAVDITYDCPRRKVSIEQVTVSYIRIEEEPVALVESMGEDENYLAHLPLRKLEELATRPGDSDVRKIFALVDRLGLHLHQFVRIICTHAPCKTSTISFAIPPFTS